MTVSDRDASSVTAASLVARVTFPSSQFLFSQAPVASPFSFPVQDLEPLSSLAPAAFLSKRIISVDTHSPFPTSYSSASCTSPRTMSTKTSVSTTTTTTTTVSSTITTTLLFPSSSSSSLQSLNPVSLSLPHLQSLTHPPPCPQASTSTPPYPVTNGSSGCVNGSNSSTTPFLGAAASLRSSAINLASAIALGVVGGIAIFVL